MVKRAGGEARPQTNIGGQLVEFIVALIEGARHGGVGKAQPLRGSRSAKRRLGSEDTIEVTALPRASERRPGLVIIRLARAPESCALEHQIIVDLVLAQKCYLLAFSIVAIEARLTCVHVGVEIGAIGQREERAFDRNELCRRIAFSVLHKADQREFRVGRRLP